MIIDTTRGIKVAITLSMTEEWIQDIYCLVRENSMNRLSFRQ